jgi:hypothetical protein
MTLSLRIRPTEVLCSSAVLLLACASSLPAGAQSRGESGSDRPGRGDTDGSSLGVGISIGGSSGGAAPGNGNNNGGGGGVIGGTTGSNSIAGRPGTNNPLPGARPGTQNPGVTSVPNASVVAAWRSMSSDEQQRLRRSCSGVLASPGNYESDLTALCQFVSRVSTR